jgi:hypothetical protein
MKSLDEFYRRAEQERIERLNRQRLEDQRRFEEIERQRQFMIKDQLLYERLHSISVSTSNAAGGSVSISVPTNLAITEDGSTLSWDSNYSNFEVWVSIDSAAYYLSGTTTLKTYNLNQLAEGDIFNYKVRAFQGTKYSQFTDIVNFTWSSYWTNRSLFFLDGTIITVGSDKYFKDKSINARDFLITRYDFDSTWTKGFPYKSAATISAPAEDATLIAADINNFLYDSGGTPNQISVVSLFQDIDYEHKIFCKHEAQELDGNGVETYEPRVIEIYMAQAVESGTVLTKAQPYFGVPAESAVALWINSNDAGSTEYGSKEEPFKTITHFILDGNTKEGYVKTGVYSAEVAYNNRQNTLHSIGRNYITASTAQSINFTGNGSDTIIKRLVTNSLRTYGVLLGFTYVDIELDNLLLNAATYSIGQAAVVGTSFTVNNSIIPIKSLLRCDSVFNSCLFNIAIDSQVCQMYAKKATFVNCKFSEITSTGMFQVKSAGAEFNLFGCTFYGNLEVDEVNVYAPKFVVQRCNIIIKTKSIIGYVNNTGVRIITINSNNITSEDAGVIGLINSIGKGSFEMNGNSIVGLLRDFSLIMSGKEDASTVEFSNNTTESISLDITCYDNIKILENNIFNSSKSTKIYLTSTVLVTSTLDIINNNTFISKDTDNVMLQLGTEGTVASYGKMDGSVVSKNKLLAPRYFGNDPGGQHCIFIFAQIVESKYNLIDGSFLGYVMKSVGQTDESIIHHNIIVDTNNPFLSKGVVGVCYYNNTVIFKESTATTIGIRLMADELYPGSESINTKFKNNIIADFRDDNYGNFIIVTTDDLVGAEIDYNIYYRKNADTQFAFVDGVGITFAEWQALGYDAHSILLTDAQSLALFTDYANGDYSLKAGSVAIGAGIALDAAYDDGLDASTEWGSDTELPVVVTKQQGAAWDIGAYVH